MTHHTFDNAAIDQALEAAQRTGTLKAAPDAGADISQGRHLKLRAQCISVTVENDQVCLNLPLGFGSVCLPIPLSIPSGTAAQACLDICTTLGIPTGITVTVSALGHVVVQETFGYC